MIQPHSGSGKGFYFIPEIGEEVLVGFEGGNVERPYVMGTHYNGEASSGYETSQNDLKVIQTRSGNRIISDDATGDITIESQKGKTIAVIYGDGNIRFKAPKNIEFKAGEDIIINAGRDIKSNAGQNITEDANGYKETNTGLFYSISIGADFLINVIGRMTEYIKGDKESRTEKDRTRVSNGKIIAQSQGTHEQHSDKEIKNNSSEKTSMF